jgi:radical SAM superfamily enzyme YgiQ (UPF0313 family)
MRFQKALLFCPEYRGSCYYGGKNFTPSLGLGYIAEALKSENVEYRVFDMGLGYSLDDLMRYASDFKPDLLAATMMTFRYKHIYAVLDRFKEAFPCIPIAVGGPHVSVWRKKVLEQNNNIDFGVFLEGEDTMRSLCRGDELDAIEGLIYRKEGSIIENKEREFISDLDNLAFPKYDRFELKKYAPVIEISSSRGCPYNCIFCQSKSALGKKWRARSAANVVEEIEYWQAKGYKRFSFVDDNFTLDKKRVLSICDELEQRSLKDIWLGTGGVRADKVDRALLKRMKDCGFKYLAFGVEGGNDRILNIVKKDESIQCIENAVKDATNLGFDVKLYFIVGSPYETLEDIKDSVRLALKFPITDVNFTNLVPFPETELMEWIKANGRLLRSPDDYLNDISGVETSPLFDAPGMSIPERIKAFKITEKARIKVIRPMIEEDIRHRYAYLGVFSLFIARLYSHPFVYQHMRFCQALFFKEGIKKILRALFGYMQPANNI